MTTTKRYCFIQDNDGHWYLCPADRRNEAQEAFEMIYAYWDDMPDDGVPVPAEPDFVKALGGGVEAFSFLDPQQIH